MVLKEAIESNAGVNRLARMSAVDSIDRNLETEDRAYKRDTERHEREMSGKAPEQAQTGDGMRVMAARDVYVNPLPHAPTPSDPSPKPTPHKAIGTLGKVAIAAALLGTGAGTTAVAMWALDKLSPPPVDQNTQYEARIAVK